LVAQKFLCSILILCSLTLAETGARYLIITPDTFIPIAQQLAQWKTAKGMLAKIVTTSEAGTDTNQILSYIRNAWNNWEIPPEYVLLLGAPEYIPSQNNYNDNYYGNMTGNYRIEIPVGRLPAHNSRECSTFVTKILAYENPPMDGDTFWFRKGTTIVREDVPPDSYYQKDAQILRGYWQQRNFLLAESLSNLYGDSSRQVDGAAHDGRIFITYRGNGVGTWYSPFNMVYPAGWQNGFKMPVVVSATCATVTLSPGESMYGDQFVRAGSSTTLGGAIAFFGTTRIGTHLSRYRSACYRGFFHALYEEGEYRLGPATMRGRFWVDSIYGDSIRYLEWNLLGDPELNVWVDAPLHPVVQHDSVIPMVEQNLTITVLVADTPFSGAQVCVSMDSTVYHYGQTDAHGRITFTVTPQHPGTLQIVVSGKNLLPYIGSCEVISRDVGCTAILTPNGTVDSSSVIYPVVKLFNYGSRIETYEVYLTIGPDYARVETVQFHQPNTDYEVVFPRWTARPRGNWQVACSTRLIADQNPGNDRYTTNIFIRVRDVAAAKIKAPIGCYYSGTIITPAAYWKNLGNVNATFQAWIIIENPAGERVYIKHQNINSRPPGDSEPEVTFAPCTLNISGKWTVRCSTYYPFDQVPVNNFGNANFTVIPVWLQGWQEVQPMPAAPSGRPVSDGGWLATLEEYHLIYAAKGNKTGDFYAYDPLADTWIVLTPIPEGSERSFPRKGATAIADGKEGIYAVKGNNTLGFWFYDVTLNLWRQLPDIPAGISGKKVKGGSDLVYVNENDTGYVYLLKGYGLEFYRFNTITGNWQPLPDAPTGIKGKWDRGSWLVYDNEHTIYAHKAKYHELWAFDIVTHQWSETALPGMPVSSTKTGKNKKSKDGGSGVFYNGSIYALKGGNTCEFWKFNPGSGSWIELDTISQIGSSGKKKRVKGGGDIVHFGGGIFFILKGNKTLELWRYVASQQLLDANAPVRNCPTELLTCHQPQADINIPRCLISDGEINIVVTNPTPVQIKIYDSAGRIVLTSHQQITSANSIKLPVTQLSPGVYLVCIQGENKSTTQKIVIMRQ